MSKTSFQSLSPLLFLPIAICGCQKTQGIDISGFVESMNDLGGSVSEIGVNAPPDSGMDEDLGVDIADAQADSSEADTVEPDVEEDLGPPPCEWQIVQSIDNPRGAGLFGQQLVASDGLVAVSNSTGVLEPDEVYLFEPGSDGQWALAQTVLPFDGGEDLGGALLLEPDLLVVGAVVAMEVSIYERNSGAFVGVDRIQGPADGVDFGRALAHVGDAIYVGAARDSTNGTNAGAVYRIEPEGTQWGSPERTGVASAAGQFVGRTLSATEDLLLVGGDNSAAVYDLSVEDVTAVTLPPEHVGFGNEGLATADAIFVGAPGGLSDGGFGKVIVFEGDGNTWIRNGLIEPAESVSRLSFGAALAGDGTRLVVGASSPNESRGGDQVFLYERDETDQWAEIARFDSQVEEGEPTSFGLSVAMIEDLVFISDSHAPTEGGTGVLHVAACR